MKKLFSLGELPISDFLKEGESPRGGKHDLQLLMEEDTGAVRLETSAPLHQMFGKYFYRSSINPLMVKELKNIVDSILPLIKLKENDIFCDIASNDGTLLSFVPKNLIRIGIDPAEDSFKEDAEKHANLIIQDFFSADIFKKSKFGNQKIKILTAIAVIYDIENLDGFLKDIYEVLDDEGLFVVQLSHSGLMINQCAFDNILSEHFWYLTLNSLKIYLERNGFNVVDCTLNDTNGGSFRVYIRKQIANDSLFSTQPYRDVCNWRINSLLHYETILKLDSSETWHRFYDDINRLKEQTVNFIKQAKLEGKTIWAYAACHDKETRLVTEDGIKNIDDVTIDDKVYTLNTDTKEIELCIIDEIIRDLYKGEMVYFKGKRIDQMLTPNHQMLFETYGNPKLRFESAEEMSKRSIFYLPKGTWNGRIEEEIDIRKFVNQDEYGNKCRKIQNIFNTNDFLYLLGIFIGDGYTCSNSQGYSINLCIPKKDKARKRVIETLNRMNLMFREYDNELQIAAKALYNICLGCGKGALNKRIPKWALEYSTSHLKYLLDGLIDSDGWYAGKTKRKNFCSSSLKLIKDVCELSLKLGYFPCIVKRKKKKNPKIRGREINANDGYVIHIATNHPSSERSNKKVKYDGKVWCLSVKNKNFLIERNGKLCFSGNSTKGNTLLNYFNIDNNMIDGVAEKSTFKWGLRTVGSNIKIYSEEEMRKAKPDYLLILAWHFVANFLEREKELLQAGTKFIVPCPEFKIISK